jgi:thymidylate synthase (FAD)
MNADAAKYFAHIIQSGHESVLEHASVSFLFYGVSRSLTHELVRHRHFSFSQVSQRYVDDSVLRFVERRETQLDPALHGRFEQWIDACALEYEIWADRLYHLQESGAPHLTSEQKTELRKRVRQVARECLPNATEAPIVTTGNHRSWREFLAKRATRHADTPIRALAMQVYESLSEISPHFYQDFSPVELDDGTTALERVTP